MWVFWKGRVVYKQAVFKKGSKCFNDIYHSEGCHPFTILDGDFFNIFDEMNEEVAQMESGHISLNNDFEGSNPKDSFDDPQNQEVVSLLLLQRGLLSSRK